MVNRRSDTVTKPRPAVRHDEVEAVTGDDDNGEDPTVRGEPGRRPGDRGRGSDPRALSVVLAGEVAWGAQGGGSAAGGASRSAVLVAQSGPSPEGLVEIQVLGPHTAPAEPESAR